MCVIGSIPIMFTIRWSIIYVLSNDVKLFISETIDKEYEYWIMVQCIVDYSKSPCILWLHFSYENSKDSRMLRGEKTIPLAFYSFL